MIRKVCLRRPSLVVRALAALLLVSCAGAKPAQPTQAAQNALWAGAPQVAVSVAIGRGADERQRADCQRALLDHEGSYGLDATVTVVVDLDQESALLRATSEGKTVREETRPMWPVSRLCTEALLFGLRVAAEQLGGAISVALKLAEPATQDQRTACEAAIEQSRIPMSPDARLTAELKLGRPGSGRASLLQISSVQQGVVTQARRPGWGVGALCQDALIQVMRAQLMGFSSGVNLPSSAPPRLDSAGEEQ